MEVLIKHSSSSAMQLELPKNESSCTEVGTSKNKDISENEFLVNITAKSNLSIDSKVKPYAKFVLFELFKSVSQLSEMSPGIIGSRVNSAIANFHRRQM